MKALFKPTNHTFTFQDTYFVQVRHAGAIASGDHEFIACFADLSKAVEYANAQVKHPDIAAAYVFSREAQHHAVYS